jgi:putative endopeptidase
MQCKSWLAVLAVIISLVSCQSNSNSAAERSFILSANMDSSVKPGDNFYQYVNGGWLKRAKIPPTEAATGTFYNVLDTTKARLRSILDSVSSGGQTQGSVEQLVGDLYAAGMDSGTIEKLGYEPLKLYLAKIDSFRNVKDLMAFEAYMNLQNHSYVISFGIGADQKNSRMNILSLGQTGLGLPDRDYYFRKDSATLALQKAYKAYIVQLLVLTGVNPAEATKESEAVYALEKEMAGSHRTNVQLRDPQSNYHMIKLNALEQTTPRIGWTNIFTQTGVHLDSLDIAQPAFYKKLNDLLASVPLSTWKAYYRFHVADDYASDLSMAFVNTRFGYLKLLNGQDSLKPRWERIYAVVDQNLGDGLGHLYAKKYFPPEAKQRIVDLVNNLQAALRDRIGKLDWMSDSTKAIAKDKLQAFLKKVGYPEKWRDYSRVSIDRGHYFEDLVSCQKNEYQYQLSKLGKPVDRTEWFITASTVDAYYNPTFNEIVFPAGILQSPAFDPQADDAMNYGGIGMVIGHEMTHGFDDQGAQYDKDGNLKNWWGKSDSARFVAKAKKVAELFSRFTVLDSLHINGELTDGENIADMGGLVIAYNAFKMTKEGQDSTKIDGLTPDQRFFISLAQIWRMLARPSQVRTLINVDPHSPPMYRVLGPLMNFTPFYDAFHVKEGDKMYLPDSSRIRFW